MKRTGDNGYGSLKMFSPVQSMHHNYQTALSFFPHIIFYMKSPFGIIYDQVMFKYVEFYEFSDVSVLDAPFNVKTPMKNLQAEKKITNLFYSSGVVSFFFSKWHTTS